jgi:uncharacterized protein YbjT (DUF2867 family)
MNSKHHARTLSILVTGATGYVGGRLVPKLIEKGHSITVLVRNKNRLGGYPWMHQVKVIEGDFTNRNESWNFQLGGFDAAYYLVHSIYSGSDFDRLDEEAAANFGKAAKSIPHVIYLGGLQPKTEKISEHLLSRAKTGRILAKYVHLTEFRAGPIIGSGSASFEMVRYLTERLPVMVTPKWINMTVQPIAIKDVLEYLIQALEHRPLEIIEIGSNPLTFKAMMEDYAKARGLRRIIIPLPVLTPWLSAQWVGLVTPIPNRLAIPLIQGIIHPILADTTRAKQYFPKIDPIPYKDAITLSLKKLSLHDIETSWRCALGNAPQYELIDSEGMIKDQHQITIQATPETVYSLVSSLGGDKGWLCWNWAWKIRGLIDRLVGGPGLRRGRRDPQNLIVGEAVDFWRVERAIAGKELLLRAEMKVPGKAWLRFEITPVSCEVCRITQTALFEPRGLWGALYWYALYPIHRSIFRDLSNTIKKECETGDSLRK